MQLRTLLEEIGLQYNQMAEMSSKPQALLRTTSKETLAGIIPVGYTTNGSGGKGQGAVTPWIAVFDKDETTSARTGIYIVYLFAIAHQTVYLSLNQGVTELREQHGGQAARKLLTDEARNIRDGFATDNVLDLKTHIDLGTKNSLSVDYEHGNIFSQEYQINGLPSNDELETDLKRFIQLYAHALEIRNKAQTKQQSPLTAPNSNPTLKVQKTAEFRPKSDSSVRRHIRASEQAIQRKHETLINQYTAFLKTQGFEVANNTHPRDLTATKADTHWLIEAKTVGTDPIRAVRDALSQLRFYEYYEYNQATDIPCLALFNEPIGASFVEFLRQQRIAVVWHERGSWHGTPEAHQNGLCEGSVEASYPGTSVEVGIEHKTVHSTAVPPRQAAHRP